MAERTGSLTLSVLWSYVADLVIKPTMYVAIPGPPVHRINGGVFC